MIMIGPGQEDRDGRSPPHFSNRNALQKADRKILTFLGQVNSSHFAHWEPGKPPICDYATRNRIGSEPVDGSQSKTLPALTLP
jgi:hypothetical protein